MIAITEPVLGDLEEKLVLEVIRSGRLAQGPMVERFEEEVRQIVGTRHAVAVDNGTDALIASLLAHGIGPGDEVITSPFTFVATLNAILHVGATPRFVDIGDDFNLHPALLERAIGPATRAVLPVHLFGCPADMVGIGAAIAGRDLVVIEDAAQALGATHAGRAVGSFGTGCFSFYATKNVTTGEGGVITTNDDEVAATLRVLRNQGQRARYDYALPGFNLRMTEIQAALGVAQMSRLPDIVESRRENARELTEGLAGVQGLALPAEPRARRHVYHQFTVRVTRQARTTRDRLLERLLSSGVQAGVYYPRPVFDYDCFRRDRRVGTPIAPRASAAAREVLSLPVHPRLGRADLSRIVEAVRGALA
ncbi:MAG TPA: DegT/DnrJ/EryC1/StrS family aminotransferase [Actinomycetota bacterium]